MDNTTRKPTLLFQLSGSILLRYEQRALSAVLFHEPPRSAGVGASRVVHSTQHDNSQHYIPVSPESSAPKPIWSNIPAHAVAPAH